MMKSRIVGILALIFSVTALGLATIPGIVLDRSIVLPPERPAEEPSTDQRAVQRESADPKADGNKGITLKFKKLSVTFGGDKEDETKSSISKEEAEARSVERNAKARVAREQQQAIDRKFKTFTISSFAFALIGLVLAPIAWNRNDNRAVPGSAVTIAITAMTWQYLVIGLILAVAIAMVFLAIRMHIWEFPI